MQFPADYIERVYAGVLGKIIGVYLGRPFEGWTYNRIIQELGEIWYYVHEQRNVPLVVTDDDISGTFTFLRALPDYGNSRHITPEQIGQTWLNYLIEKRTVLWWGGMGNSTEHTAYLRLKHGIPAPTSGAIITNGKTVAEQVGAQIFIDGWAMVSPGDPDQAAEFARRAASVSHDGEAVYAAQVLAAMEAMAFIESDRSRLIDTGITYIPKDSVIYRLIADLRQWHTQFADWRDARLKVVENYGYDRYGGNCHVVPNHALIQLGFLYGEDDFQKTLMITNTSGWDTDCNSGNIGCLMGIKLGLAGINSGPDWRGPVADQFYLPTADGGNCLTDAVTETVKIVNIASSLANLPVYAPKYGAHFHFELPGSVQGWRAEELPGSRDALRLKNVPGHSQDGTRSLSFQYNQLNPGRIARASVPVFMSPEMMNMPGYSLYASPLLYPGQIIHANLTAENQNDGPVNCRIWVSYYADRDCLEEVLGPTITLHPGERQLISWKFPVPSNATLGKVGLDLTSLESSSGSVFLDYLTWDGVPDVVFEPPFWEGTAWRKAWVNGVDHFESGSEPYRLIQDEGTGLLIQGTRQWCDYQVTADVTPHMVAAAGLAGRVQGMRRYYALQLVHPGKIQLLKALDGFHVLAEADFPWEFGFTYLLSLTFRGNQVFAQVNGESQFTVTDLNQPLESGGIGLLCTEGRTATWKVSVKPVNDEI